MSRLADPAIPHAVAVFGRAVTIVSEVGEVLTECLFGYCFRG